MKGDVCMGLFREIVRRADKKTAITTGAILVLVVVIEIVLTVLIPEWKSNFFSVMQAKDVDKFWVAIALFAALMLSLGAMQGVKTWLAQTFSFEFRRVASKILLKKWVKGGKTIKNYTQAQTEALRYVTEIPVMITTEAFISLFIVISLLLVNLDKPTVVISSLVYTLAVIVVAKIFNKPLVTTHTVLQETEGSYREAISDIQNGHGDFSSKQKYLNVTVAYLKYIKTQMYFRLFGTLKGSLTSIVPYVLMAEGYFSGAYTLGQFMAAVSTFELIVINATILVQLYPESTKVVASWKIVNGFYKEVIR